MKYICKNPDCPKYGTEEYYVSETFKYVNGKLIGNHVICPQCGKDLNTGECGCKTEHIDPRFESLRSLFKVDEEV